MALEAVAVGIRVGLIGAVEVGLISAVGTEVMTVGFTVAVGGIA